MTSVFPGGLDAFTTAFNDSTRMENVHAQAHVDANDAINKIEAELGVNPSGSFATVKDRLAFSGARIFSASSVAVPNNVDTVVPFDSERYDTDGYHSLVNNTSRITIPRSGKHHIGCVMTMDQNLVGRRYATLRLTKISDGTTYKIDNLGLPLNTDGGGGAHRPVGGPCCDWDFVAGDYVELVVFQDSGVALTLPVFTDQATEMWIHWLGN